MGGDCKPKLIQYITQSYIHRYKKIQDTFHV